MIFLSLRWVVSGFCSLANGTDGVQLSDLAFQRHILVQALILIDFLFSLTEKSKKKAYYENAQRAMQYEFTLGEREVSPCHPFPFPGCGRLAVHTPIISADCKAQAEWALGIKNQIANYLQDCLDGKFYYRMVDTVLSRDKNWVRWKMENCQPFTRDRVSTKDFLEAKTGAQKLVDGKAIVKPKSFGLNLEFLTETQGEKGLERLKRKDRYVPLTRVAYIVPCASMCSHVLTSRQVRSAKCGVVCAGG